MIMRVNRTGATDEPATSSAQRAVALRGELWQRHVRLRELDTGGADYDDAVIELVDLTTELLGAEAAMAQEQRSTPRRTNRLLYAALGVLLLAVIVLLVLAALAVRASVPLWALVSLLVVIAALAVMLMLRRRDRAIAPPTTAPDAAPPAPSAAETAAATQTPHTSEATDSQGDAGKSKAVIETEDDSGSRINVDSGANGRANGKVEGLTNGKAQGLTSDDGEPERS